MGKVKKDLKKLIGREVKLNDRGISAGYGSYFPSRKTKVLKVHCNTLYVDRAGYPSGYAIISDYFDTDISLSKEDFNNDIKDLENEKSEIDKQIEECKIKIKFIEDTGLEEFDEETFKAFKILELIEKSKMSKIDKAKKISEIVKA